MTLEGIFTQFVYGLAFGSGFITAAIIFKAAFGATVCGG